MYPYLNYWKYTENCEQYNKYIEICEQTVTILKMNFLLFWGLGKINIELPKLS